MNPPLEYMNLPWMENSSKSLLSGEVLVSMECSRGSGLELYNGEGSKLPAYLIYIVLKIALGEGWVEELENLHIGRQNIWKVDVSLSPIGEKQYRLFTIGQDGPVCTSAISVLDGHIDTFSILSEDAAPLLKEIIQDNPPVFLPRYKNYRYTYCFPTNFPFYVKHKKFLESPGPLKKQREETQKIIVDKDVFLTRTFEAGHQSGIIETIEALKCMEVLLA